MELTINYSYVEQIIPPRCRKPRPQRFNDGVAVLTVREVTGEQAPIAILASEKDFENGTYHEPVAYRWFEGRLWTDRSVSGGSLSRAKCYPTLGPTLNLVSDSPMHSKTDLGIYVCAHEGKQGVADHLHSAATDWLIIDGKLHRTAGEPKYVVMTFGMGCNHGGTALMTDYRHNHNIEDHAYFSLLELDAAREYTLTVANERGDTVKVDTDPRARFEVLKPEVIQWKNTPRPADDTAGLRE